MIKVTNAVNKKPEPKAIQIKDAEQCKAYILKSAYVGKDANPTIFIGLGEGKVMVLNRSTFTKLTYLSDVSTDLSLVVEADLEIIYHGVKL